MKKQIKKLCLNKKTISNLNEVEMDKKVGGARTGWYCFSRRWCGGGTRNGNTCYDHNTCQYTCI